MTDLSVDESPNVNEDSLFISDESMQVFLITVNIFILGIISFMGVVNNILNMTIFVKQALKDSMTVGLFALALADFSVTTLELSISCIYVASILCPWSPVDLWALAYVSFAWAVYACYLVSCWLTAMISLERCFCVVSPFKVRDVFTRRRCCLVICVIYAIHISTFLPVFIIEKMQWVPLPLQAGNSSLLSSESNIWVYTVVFSEATTEVETAMDITGGMFLFLTSQLVLYTCSVWMTVSLKLSSQVRSNKSLIKEQKSSAKPDVSRLTNKEKRLVRLVLFIATLQSVCNLPRLTITIFYHAFPGINVEKHKNFSTIIWTSSVVVNNISCSCNTFGYYLLNSSYRRMFRKMFRVQDR